MAEVTDDHEIAAFLARLESSNNGGATADDNVQYYADYRRAQVLQVQGHFRESLPYLTSSFELLKAVKHDFAVEMLYYSVGSLYASTLDHLGKFNDAELVYKELLTDNPTGDYICDYAVFLHRRKRDYQLADSFFNKALELYPTYSSLHLKYAGFLRHVKRDPKAAEKHYREAISVNPENSEALGSFASFLHGITGDMEEAEKYYKLAVEKDSVHVNNLCNYGLFLSEVKRDYVKAEECYQRALSITDNHANTLYNYGVMLDTHCDRKIEAEGMYSRALEVEPRHPFALYNLAVLLEERLPHADTIAVPPTTTTTTTTTDTVGATAVSTSAAIVSDASSTDAGGRAVGSDSNDEARYGLIARVTSLYERAIAVDPNDSSNMADFGRFLWNKTTSKDKAESILSGALDIDSNNETALLNLGILKLKFRNDPLEAEKLLRRLILVNPKHSIGLLQLARALTEVLRAGKRDSMASSSGTAAVNQIPSSSSSRIGRGRSGSDSAGVTLQDIVDCYEKSISLQKEARDIKDFVMEYLFFVNSLGTPHDKLKALSFVESLQASKKINIAVSGAGDLQRILTTLRTSS